MKVSILFGSKSDAEVMKKTGNILKEFEIEYNYYVVSAHRTPELLTKILEKVEEDGTRVIIAGAGLAAHLPGVIASKTLIPVIGVPLTSGGLGGLDALLSIVQMPKQIPVATVGIDNAANAAYLAVQIIATMFPSVKNKLVNYRKQMKEDLEKEFNSIEI